LYLCTSPGPDQEAHPLPSFARQDGNGGPDAAPLSACNWFHVGTERSVSDGGTGVEGGRHLRCVPAGRGRPGGEHTHARRPGPGGYSRCFVPQSSSAVSRLVACLRCRPSCNRIFSTCTQALIPSWSGGHACPAWIRASSSRTHG
jgi:hypothetical protein